MTDDNTIARSLHDLGLGAWFGGTLMGTVGLNRAAGEARDPAERTLLSSEGWRRWVPWNAAAIGAHVLGSVLLTAANRRRLAYQGGVRSTALAKAGLTAAALGATGYARYVGRRIEEASNTPVTSPTEPAAATPPELARWQRRERALQWVVPALTGMVMVMGARMGEQQRPGHVLSGVADKLLSDLSGVTDRLPDLSGVADRLPDMSSVSDRLPDFNGVADRLHQLSGDRI